MTRATGPLARLALPVLLTLAASAPVAAQAEPPKPAPPVHELRSAPLAAPSQVPPRLPAPSFRTAPTAAASSLRVLDVTALGTRTNGKIVATDPSGIPYSCSGTALNTPSRSVVLTAGHCVGEGRARPRRLAFVPAYDHGRRPFGTYEVSSIFVMPQWRRGGNHGFDVAALRVKPSRLGSLTDVVGGRGWVTSKSRLAAFQIFGYPAARLGGEELRVCRARGLGVDRLSNRLPGPPTMPASCDMAAGASGGAWLFDGQYLSGVTSYGYQGRPTQLFSPYFGPAIGGFLRQLP